MSDMCGYRAAWKLFVQGRLEVSQSIAERGYRQYRTSRPELAVKFQMLEAESMLWRGMNQDALHILSRQPEIRKNAEDMLDGLILEGAAFTHLRQFPSADQRLGRAETLCEAMPYAICGEVPRALGVLAMERGDLAGARKYFLQGLAFADSHHDRWLETTVLLDLGVVALQTERYDEAVGWLKSANRAALEMGADDIQEKALGNLAWAYFGLGDGERALEDFVDAGKHAARLGSTHAEINWLISAGDVSQDRGDSIRAAQSYRQALDLANSIKSYEDMVNVLEDLAHASIKNGQIGEAASYVAQLAPLLPSNGNRLDALDVQLAEAGIAAARGEGLEAESLFRAVERDPASQTSMRLGAEHELARLYESEGRAAAAADMYEKALSTFEAARAELKDENSKLPFLANAAPIYDDYVHFLASQKTVRQEKAGRGSPELALMLADQSRARTLAQGLGVISSTRAFPARRISPKTLAKRADATLLFYWLGEKQSYLWVITPAKIRLFPLPPQAQILPLIERYSAALQGPEDPLLAANADGLALYRILVAPAAALLPKTVGAAVTILADGPLTQLNFETLLVPGPVPGHVPVPGTPLHYWIEDVTLTQAPSLAMLAAAKRPRMVGRNLLLVGDAVSPGSEYPPLPLAASEIAQIQKHFSAREQTVLARREATPAAYLASRPERFAYIHFVAHGVASRTDPLESAIILSPPGGGRPLDAGNSPGSDRSDGFKLYAREIMRHPIDARLVTIAGCYGSGTRIYKGEGLVGLSWAFLRAGAHNTIGALWAVSDDATPQLMDSLYRQLEQGQSPAASLRQAKLKLLHAPTVFRKPYYWAAFQLYSR